MATLINYLGCCRRALPCIYSLLIVKKNTNVCMADFDSEGSVSKCFSVGHQKSASRSNWLRQYRRNGLKAVEFQLVTFAAQLPGEIFG